VTEDNIDLEIRFQGARWADAKGAPQGEAFVQALEVGPGPAATGARPISRPL